MFCSTVSFVSGDTRLDTTSPYGGKIVIQVSNNTLHQINSRIFGILLTEILNQTVIYEDIQFTKDLKQLDERDKLYDIIENIKNNGEEPEGYERILKNKSHVSLVSVS